MDFTIFATADAWIALLTLSFLEIVLGIDNIIFISLMTNKLPKEIQGKARTAGIGLALLFRVLMLLGISWIIGFTQPVFEVFEHAVTGRDLILFFGGLFLLMKSTREIHHKVASSDHSTETKASGSLFMAIVQIGLLDIVFSFDSILTAIGMTREILIMIIAVIISLLIMLAFAKKISEFIQKFPSLQILALAFLILIGFILIAESFHQEIPKGYIYFAVAFSLGVEVVNLRLDKKSKMKS